MKILLEKGEDPAMLLCYARHLLDTAIEIQETGQPSENMPVWDMVYLANLMIKEALEHE